MLYEYKLKRDFRGCTDFAIYTNELWHKSTDKPLLGGKWLNLWYF